MAVIVGQIVAIFVLVAIILVIQIMDGTDCTVETVVISNAQYNMVTVWREFDRKSCVGKSLLIPSEPSTKLATSLLPTAHIEIGYQSRGSS